MGPGRRSGSVENAGDVVGGIDNLEDAHPAAGDGPRVRSRGHTWRPRPGRVSAAFGMDKRGRSGALDEVQLAEDPEH